MKVADFRWVKLKAESRLFLPLLRKNPLKLRNPIKHITFKREEIKTDQPFLNY